MWLAQFASTCFRGNALRWHANLEVEVQQDWTLLERALLEKYDVVRV